MSLFASFQETLLPLPALPINWTVPKLNENSGGSGTKAADAPALWLDRSLQDYTQLADDLIQKLEVATVLRETCLPALWNPCPLQTESNVMTASHLWLLHPVIIALQAQYPNVKCDTESPKDNCRCDIIIHDGDKALVVIECKRRAYLRKREFNAARADEHDAEGIKTMMAKRYENDNNRGSYLDGNARYLSKQAAAYSLKWQTRFVVLFDWDSMFLYNFAGMNLGMDNSEPEAQDWAYGTWVKRRVHYRKALLGFILAARADQERPNFDQGVQKPWEQ